MQTFESLVSSVSNKIAGVASWPPSNGDRTWHELEFNLTELVSAATGSETDLGHAATLLNLIVDLLQSRIDRVDALECMALSPSSTPPRVSILTGPTVAIPPLPGDRTCTVIRWSAFCDYYAARFGCSRFDAAALEELWGNATRGELRTPSSDLQLTSWTGVVWFTSMAALRREASLDPGRALDPTAVYDVLGLDWSRRWDDLSDSRFVKARAVALTCDSRLRFQVAVSVPTAIDGWGNFLFVPTNPRDSYAWPMQVGLTVCPTTGAAGCAEAVHGPLAVAPAQDVAVETIGFVSKPSPGERLAECGSRIVQRNLDRCITMIRARQ